MMAVNMYTVPVGRCNKKTVVEQSKYEDERKNELFGPGKSISNKKPRNLS